MISGKIARILSETEVVLNVGRKHGVEEGMQFVIYSVGDPIIDPDSGEALGALENVKGRVEVTHVMEALSRARTRTHTVTRRSAFALGLSDMLRETYEAQEHDRLPVKKDQIQPASEDRTVVVGDIVKSV
jgi:hypothetical protein